jgi:ribosomal protein S21
LNDKPRQKLHVRNYEQKKQFKKRPEQEQATGLSVKVHGDDITKALRIFKKKILTADILNEARERQHYTKKSEKNRLSKSAGRQRWLRKLATIAGPHQYDKNYRKKHRGI